MLLNAELDLNSRQSLKVPPKVPGDLKVAMVKAALSTHAAKWIMQLFAAVFRSPGKLTIDEAFYYRFLDGDLSVDQISRFVGKRGMAAVHPACNDMRWYAASDDKALFYCAARGAGFRTPETLAISGPGRRSGFGAQLIDEAEIARFLKQNTQWPLFLKPIDGIYSIGILKVLGIENNAVTLDEYGVVGIEDLTAYINAMSKVGYLYQRFLEPSAIASESFGGALPSVRFLTLQSGDRPAIESAVIKIPRQNSVADNYWRNGNMLGAVDRESGKVERVVSGLGASMETHERHPDTDVPLVGFRIPDWNGLCETVLSASTMFPGVRTQSWDIALTNEGPAILEFNFGGDLNLHQIAHRRGALSDSYAEHLRRCGYKGKIP